MGEKTVSPEGRREDYPASPLFPCKECSELHAVVGYLHPNYTQSAP
jgi:hypothetical protein